MLCGDGQRSSSLASLRAKRVKDKQSIPLTLEVTMNGKVAVVTGLRQADESSAPGSVMG